MRELATQRAWTRLGQALRRTGALAPEAIAATAEAVASQARTATGLGARSLSVVATAAVRQAPDAADLAEAVRRAAGLEVEVLSDAEEARLAFVGATHTSPVPPSQLAAVADVGGGSTELAVGVPDVGVDWWSSAQIGSGVLADLHLRTDPPTAVEWRAGREEVRTALGAMHPPRADHALVVGGSVRSLRRLVGEELTPGTVERAIAMLASAPSEELARRYDIDPDRARLLPGGATIVRELLEVLAPRLAVARGGLREGVILELCDRARAGAGGESGRPSSGPGMGPATK